MDRYEAATDAVQRFLAGEVTQDYLARMCYPLVKRSAKMAAVQTGVNADDAAQELWLLFVEKIIPRYQADRPLFPFVNEFARRHCLSMRNDSRELLLADLTSDGGDDQAEAGQWLLDEALVDQGIDIADLDQRRAEEEFIRLLTAGRETVVQSSVAVYHSLSTSVSSHTINGRTEMPVLLPGVDSIAVEKKPSIDDVITPYRGQRISTYQRTSEQEELRNIRLQLGMTKEMFAEQLGIKQSTLDSYEYGKTNSVPGPVMSAARRLAENSSDDLAEARKKFEGLSMNEILQGWAERLGVPIENATLLANMLNTTATTIRRWRDDKVRPDLAKLLVLDNQITMGPEGAAIFAAKQAVQRLRKESPETKGAVFIFANLMNGAVAALRNIEKPKKDTRAALADLRAAIAKAQQITMDTGDYLIMDASTFSNITRRLADSLSS